MEIVCHVKPRKLVISQVAAHGCEDTPSRPHATTTPYDPSPSRRATTTHVTTQVKTPRSPIALYSKSLNCNLGIFLIFFLTRLRYRPFSIGEIISHVLRPLALEPEISLSLFACLPAFDCAPFSIELAPSSARSYLTYKARSYLTSYSH